MRNILSIALLTICLNGHCQSVSIANDECGTILPSNYLQWRNGIISTQNLVSNLKHDTCLNKKFSIAFHVVLDSNYQWGAVSPADLSTCIITLNNAFKRICVSFENCFVDEIPNYTYNSWEMTATEALVLPSWNVENTINIYLVDSILGFPAGYAGSVIVIEKPFIGGSVTIHEMGHFFGLPHTWAEIGTNPVSPAPSNSQVGSNEWVRRVQSNCKNHGDGFCDTEADCYPAGFDKITPLPCKHVPGSTDGFGDYYVPPVDNYMTYFKCGCRFSQEQYNFMASVILASKIYLH